MKGFPRRRNDHTQFGAESGASRTAASPTTRVLGCPTVVLEGELYTRLNAYVRAAEGEITLYATSEVDLVRNEIRVGGYLLLPEQRSSSSETVVSEEALARLLVEAVEMGVDTSKLNVWIHSHGEGMGAFFSATDDRAITEGFPQADLLLSLVISKDSMDIMARLSLSNPFHIELDDVPISIGLTDELEVAIREEVRQKVQPRYSFQSPGSWSDQRSLS